MSRPGKIHWSENVGTENVGFYLFYFHVTFLLPSTLRAYSHFMQNLKCIIKRMLEDNAKTGINSKNVH